MAPINAVILRAKMNIDFLPGPSPTLNPPISFGAAVAASDSGMRANDRMLLHGSLSNIRLFHILELLVIIYDGIQPVLYESPHELFDEGRYTRIWNHILPAIVAYTLRSFCTDWAVGDSWGGVDGARVAAVLEDPCNDERIQRFSLRFVREFLQ